MLVLTRRVGESIRVGDDIVVTLVQIGPGKVRIGIEAPSSLTILREELVDQTAKLPPLALPGSPNLPTSPTPRMS
ncbi:MAG: carbon storage regulator [Planctomycetaceae bacterium]|nr:carbon storage regulator [Planctomycetaceae bacterium]